MENIFKRLLHKLRYSFSYPYRISRGVGLSVIRNDKELEAVIKFCREELKDKEHMDCNPDRKRIYEMTILLYEQGRSNDKEVYTKLHKFESIKQEMFNEVEEFISEYNGWYWN